MHPAQSARISDRQIAFLRGARSELAATLERCTHALQASAQYRHDVRFLRVWLLLVRPTHRHSPELTAALQAECSSNASAVFERLEVLFEFSLAGITCIACINAHDTPCRDLGLARS
jgi:hypothetical protein